MTRTNRCLSGRLDRSLGGRLDRGLGGSDRGLGGSDRAYGVEADRRGITRRIVALGPNVKLNFDRLRATLVEVLESVDADPAVVSVDPERDAERVLDVAVFQKVLHVVDDAFRITLDRPAAVAIVRIVSHRVVRVEGGSRGMEYIGVWALAEIDEGALGKLAAFGCRGETLESKVYGEQQPLCW
jgi:hypothetical protein